MKIPNLTMHLQIHADVTSEIVSNGYCIGCGVCAGVCPSKLLEMNWQENGDRVPIKAGECPPKCNLCLRVCPFSDQDHNESTLAKERFGAIPGIQYHEVVGYYLSTYVGYSLVADHRSRGSSGGMCTWMLETLLDIGQVDAVVCVGRGESPDCLFTYKIVQDIESVRSAAGSRYYPVDIAETLKLLQAPGPERRYAVVGLPCTLKALRLAMIHSPQLRRRVTFLLGLVCGHLPNRYYTEYLTRLSGVPLEQVVTVDYRLKGKDRAGNYLFRARTIDGTEGKRVPFQGRVSWAWNMGYFQYNACDYCDDVFAEVADAVFMDAWLAEYELDPHGHSLIIVRSPRLREILEKGREEGACYLHSVSVEKIIDSQRGAVRRKKEEIAGRLYWARKCGYRVPRKRIAPSESSWRQHRREIEARVNIRQRSKEIWPRLRDAPLWRFHLAMLRVEWPLRIKVVQKRVCRLIRRAQRSDRSLSALLCRLVPEKWRNILGISKEEQ